MGTGMIAGECEEIASETIMQEIQVKVTPLEPSNSNESQSEAGTSRDKIEPDNQQPSTSLDEICRICHAGISMGDLLAPCKCRGSIALTHMKCLERWLKESGNNNCELCNHHFQIIREPRYSIPMSILLFLRHPGEHVRELLLDLLAFTIYTPSAVMSTYILMLICDRCSVMRQRTVISANIVACTAILGMAAIDFTYSSWLTICFQRHQAAWRDWYRNHCEIQIILPPEEDADKKPEQDDDASED